MLRKRPRHATKLTVQVLELLNTSPPLTRSEIAKQLGLKKSVVAGVVGLLIGVGAVQVVGSRMNESTGLENQIVGLV